MLNSVDSEVDRVICSLQSALKKTKMDRRQGGRGLGEKRTCHVNSNISADENCWSADGLYICWKELGKGSISVVNLLMMRVENRDLDFFSRKMNLNVSTEYHPSQTIYFFFSPKGATQFEKQYDLCFWVRSWRNQMSESPQAAGYPNTHRIYQPYVIFRIVKGWLSRICMILMLYKKAFH